MQRPDENKRALIATTAARMFAAQPFHKVRLDDIAAEAKIGKGTLYVYFASKENLYFSLIYDGFTQLVGRLREQLGGDASNATPAGSATNGSSLARPSAAEGLRRIVTGLVRFAFQHPDFFEMMREMGTTKVQDQAGWNQRRTELLHLIEGTLRRGVEAGELCDPHPELTALFLPGMVRSVMLFGRKGLAEQDVAGHILRMLERGIVRGEGSLARGGEAERECVEHGRSRA